MRFGEHCPGIIFFLAPQAGTKGSTSSIWHLQPRAGDLRNAVTQAAEDQLQGAIAIHWRTEETRANLDLFAQAAADPGNAPSVEQFYLQDCTRQFGEAAAPAVQAILTELDRTRMMELASPVYYPYHPKWGKMKPEVRKQLEKLHEQLLQFAPKTEIPEHRTNLQWLADKFAFTLLLDSVGRNLEPVQQFQDRHRQGKIAATDLPGEVSIARKSLARAPVEKAIRTFARTVRSQGERGELSSINQRLWLYYRDLKRYLAKFDR